MPRYAFYDWSPFAQPSAYEVGERARRAKERLGEEGREMAPVEPVTGRLITTTFWGKAWCRNLLQYSDYENRMPRGRSYVRHGSVIHLGIEAGKIRALVSGREIYEVEIGIRPLPKKRWEAIRGECAGEIESLVELLEGKPPRRVMEIVTRPGDGLFPAPKEIELGCSCPDWAEMCKHVAAVLYGVGVRLDTDPEQLFRLRSVDPTDLVSTLAEPPPEDEDALAGEDLSAMFGIDLEDDDAPTARSARKAATRRKVVRKKATRKKATRKAATRKKVVRKAATRKKVVRRAATRKKVVRKAATRKKIVRKAATRKKIVRKAATRKKVVRKTVTRKKIVRKAATRKKVVRKAATRKKVVRKTATRKKATRKKVAGKRVERKKIVRKKVARVWAVPRETVRKKVVRRKVSRKKTARKKAARKRATGKKVVRRIPRKKAPRKKAVRRPSV